MEKIVENDLVVSSNKLSHPFEESIQKEMNNSTHNLTRIVSLSESESNDSLSQDEYLTEKNTNTE